MSIPNCSNGAEATATRGWVLPRASLVLTITTAQKIFAISSSRDKISCHNFARLSAWWVRLWRKRRIQTALRQRQHAVAHCRKPRLFSQSLPRRKSLLSVRAGTKSPATISQDCLLGVGVLCTQAGKRTLIQGVLINGMCNLEDGTRAATAARKRTPSLTKSTSERTSLDSFRPRTSGIKRER